MRSRGWVVGVLAVLGGAGCSGEVVECKAASLALIEVTVLSQGGEPVEAATVELDREPCTEEGGGLYTCTATFSGTHDLFVLGGMEYAAHAEKIEVPELGCDEVRLPVEVSLLPAMAR